MKVIYKVASLLLVVGGLNWGLVGLFQFDLVAALFGGSTSVVARVVYSLVGVSALVSIVSYFTCKDCCKVSDSKPISNTPVSGM